MAKTVVLNFKLNGAEQSVKNISELKSAIQELENNLNNAKFGSAGFERQKAQLDELKDKYSEMSKTASQSAAESAEKFQKAGDDFEKFSKGMVDAFTGVAIAIGASDEDTEAFMRTFVQFQGIATGVKGAIEGVLVVTKNWSAIQKVLNAVLFANPIGLIVLGVAALAGGIYLLIKNIDAVIEVFSDWKNIVLALLGPLGWILIAMNEINKAENKQATDKEKASAEATAQSKKRVSELKAEHAEFKKAKEAENATLEKRIQIQENTGESSYALRLQLAENNAAILKDEVETVRGILLAKQEEFRVKAELAGMTKDAYAQSIGLDYGVLVEQATAFLDEMTMDVQVAESEVTKIKKDEQAKRSEAAQAEADKENEIREKAYQDELARLKNLQAQRNQLLLDIETAENNYYDSKLTQQQRDEQAVNDYYFNLKTKAEEEKLNTEILEEAHQAKLAEIRDKYAADEEAKRTARQQAAQAQFDAYIADQEQKEKDLSQAKFDIASQSAAAAISLASTVFTLTNAFGKQDEASRLKRAKRQFQINKALAISEATISTINGVVNALSAKSIVPEPFGMVLRIANAVAVGAAGAANIAKIASQKFDTGGSASGGGATASTGSSNIGAGGFGDVSSPTLNTQTLFSSGGGQTQTITPFGNKSAEAPIVKAIVVESDITNMQKNIFNIERRASLGIAG